MHLQVLCFAPLHSAQPYSQGPGGLTLETDETPVLRDSVHPWPPSIQCLFSKSSCLSTPPKKHPLRSHVSQQSSTWREKKNLHFVLDSKDPFSFLLSSFLLSFFFKSFMLDLLCWLCWDWPGWALLPRLSNGIFPSLFKNWKQMTNRLVSGLICGPHCNAMQRSLYHGRFKLQMALFLILTRIGISK